MDAGRESTLDTSRLRGEPRGARRPADRLLPPPHARPANAVADLLASTRETPRRRARRRIGVCNVNRAQLDEALELAPISIVQVALSILDDTALRGGIVERCSDAGIALMAHSPLGGPRRVGRLAHEQPLAALAHERGVPRRARARLDPRSRPEHRRDTRGSPTGNRSLVRSRRVHAPRQGRACTARPSSTPASAPRRRQG